MKQPAVMRHSWRLLLLGLLCSLVAANARAQLQTCTDVNATAGYKILLDDIRFNSGATSAQDAVLMDLLKFQLNNRLADTTRYKLIRCAGRNPSETSFAPLILEGLINRDVVLEVWGEVFPANAGMHRVFLTYAMLPLPQTNVSPFLQRQYQPKVGTSPDDLINWLANLTELSAYAMVARAIRLLDTSGSDAYDSAKADLESAADSLRRAFGVHPAPNQQQLLSFIVARKCQILRDARTNTNYKGPLTHLPDAVLAKECPAGGPQ
jgi:hypothetical protein